MQQHVFWQPLANERVRVSTFDDAVVITEALNDHGSVYHLLQVDLIDGKLRVTENRIVDEQ